MRHVAAPRGDGNPAADDPVVRARLYMAAGRGRGR
jgi:hypothetical protein